MKYNINNICVKQYPKVQAYFRNKTQDKWLVEDLTQEVFVKICKWLPAFRGDCAVSTWIYTLARSTWCNYIGYSYAKGRNKVESSDVHAVVAADNTEPGDFIDITNKISRLSTRQRDILACAMQDLSYKEIGEKLGIRAGTVKSGVSRIKSKLQ